MTKKTSNFDLITFQAERFLSISEKGVKIEVFNKRLKEWQIVWFPQAEVKIGKYNQRLNDIEFFEAQKEIKIPIWLALKKDLL